MVKSGETPLAATPRSGMACTPFSREHQGKFEIGMQPVEQYLARNNLDNQVDPKVTQEIKRIQRVYQITPSTTAMNALLKKDLDSAYAVVRYDQASSSRRFKDELGGEAQARLTYAKAQQVHNAVLNIATSVSDRQHRARARRRTARRRSSILRLRVAQQARKRRRRHRLSDPGRPLRRDGLLRLRALPLDPQPGRLPGGSAACSCDRPNQ